MLNRRALMTTAAAAAVAPTLVPSLARAAAGTRDQLNDLFDAFFQENLRASPERATQLGLDKGADADLKAKLSDVGPAGQAMARAKNKDQLARLKGFDPSALNAADRLNYDTILYTLESQAAAAKFDFGGSAFSRSPYVVSQLTGVYQDVPDFLDTKHLIETKADADAYLSRLNAFAGQLDDNTRQMKHDAGLGVIAPDFLLDLTLTQLTKTRLPADQTILVTSIDRRAKAKGLGEGYGRDARKIYDEKIAPALERQIAEARAHRARVTHDAGCWRFKNGPEFYATALRGTTTTNYSPDEVHKIGLEQGKEISARIDGLLKAQGMGQGTIAARIAALYKDPKQLYPNTDQGKVEQIAYANKRLADIRPRLLMMFKRLPDPKYHFEVRRVPAQTEAGAASAFSQGASLDGSRPGIVYFNLHDAAEWPKFCLSSTVFHEGLPGHQLEGSLALSNANLPTLRKTTGFSGYGEGWALYAEQLADEMGLYDDDPLGRIGYLKFQLFRANRLVVDTGLHHFKWSRERAIAQFVDSEGEAPGFAAREVERYCATPGQACSYKLGHTVIVNLRARAKAELGAKFDIREFHEAILGTGRVPLDILQASTGRWIAARKAA